MEKQKNQKIIISKKLVQKVDLCNLLLWKNSFEVLLPWSNTALEVTLH